MQSNRSDEEDTGGSVSDRLDTWKEVASHLRRSVRTVQRWEREEGLPVHRHHHEKQGSIYAFRQELDAWWTARGAALDHQAHTSAIPEPAERPDVPTVEVPSQPIAAHRAPWVRTVLFTGTTVALVAVMAMLIRRDRAAVSPTQHREPHRILVAEFENHTAEPQLTARLRDVIQDQLSTDQLAQVVPADQVAVFLRLMRKPESTSIDAVVAREIGLRDGAIAAFVVGGVDRIESNYVANIRIATPAEGAVVASLNARAPTSAQLLDGIRREVTSKRWQIDAALRHDVVAQPPPRVTTGSFQALGLYAEAVKLMDHVPIKTGPAFELLTEAVRADPEFASAHILAAWSLRNARRPQSELLPYAERAFKLANITTDAERYFILGSYYQLTFDVERAIAPYEALLRLDPSHYWALGNLGRLYRAVGRNEAASELRERQVAIRPEQFWGNFRLAEALLLKGDLRASEEYAVRAAAQVSATDPGELQSRHSWLEILPACKAWLRDDHPAALTIVDDLNATLPRRHGTDREAMATGIGYMYLALGRRDAAEEAFRRVPDARDRLYHLAVLGAHFGDDQEVRNYFDAAPEPTSASASFHGFPALGRRWSSRASELLDRWTKSLETADATLVRGQVALMQNRNADAIRLLQESVELREDRSGTPALAAALGIAHALALDGNALQAIHTVEDASRNRFASCLWPTANAHLWVRLRAKLAQLYRHVGRDRDAVAVETQLASLLVVSDGERLASPAGLTR